MPEGEHPETQVYFDLYNESLLIGEAAHEAAIEAMERGGLPTDIHLLSDLAEGYMELPAFAEHGKKDKYAGKTKQDFINDGRWLLRVVGNLSTRKIGRLCRLGMIPAQSTLSDPEYFGSLPAFQEFVGQEKITRYRAFDHWDVIDVIAHLRSVGLEEKDRPTRQIISRRVTSGKKEPGIYIINKIVPLMEAIELAGYVVPRGWAPRQYEEWGYLFYLANGRLPVDSDLYNLSPRHLAPSNSGIELIYEGSFNEFKKSVVALILDRKTIQLDEIADELDHVTYEELKISCENDDKFIRRVARYKIFNTLMPSMPRSTALEQSWEDDIGLELIESLQRRDHRIEGWMVEAAARRYMFYPELFPTGDFYESLKVPNRMLSFSSDRSRINLEALSELIDEKPSKKVILDKIEEDALKLIMRGNTLPYVARQVLGVKNEKRLRQDHLRPLMTALNARNYPHLVRRVVHEGLVKSRPLKGPRLTIKQREVLELISYGASQNDIANTLYLAKSSVTRHVIKIKRNLRARNEAQAVANGYGTGDLSLHGKGEYWHVDQDAELEAAMGFPTGFLARIRLLEKKLSNPPPPDVMRQELKNKSDIIFNGREKSE